MTELHANEGGLLGAEDFPAGEAVANEVPLVEFPDDFFVAGDFENLGVVFAGVAVANHEVSVGEFLEVGGPGEFNFGVGDFLGDFPDDFLGGVDFDDGVAAAGGDESVAVLEAKGAVNAGVGGVFPDDFSFGIVFGDNAGVLGGGEVVAVFEKGDEAGVLAAVLAEGDGFVELAFLIDVDDASDVAFDDDSVSVGEAVEGVDVDVFAFVPVGGAGLVFPDDFFAEGDFGRLGPGVVEEDVAVFEEVEVVVSGMALLRAGGVVFPEDLSVVIADGEDVLAVGGTDKDEAVVFGEEKGG